MQQRWRRAFPGGFVVKIATIAVVASLLAVLSAHPAAAQHGNAVIQGSAQPLGKGMAPASSARRAPMCL